MKKAKIKGYTLPEKDSIYTRDHLFSIYYNDRTKKFTSKRDCECFIANLNKTISVYLTDLNYIYIDMFCLYRKTYQIIDNELYSNAFKFVDNAFYKSLNHCGQNRNVFVFREIYLIINQLVEVCTFYHDFEIKRKNYDSGMFLKMTLNRLLRIKEEILKL